MASLPLISIFECGATNQWFWEWTELHTHSQLISQHQQIVHYSPTNQLPDNMPHVQMFCRRSNCIFFYTVLQCSVLANRRKVGGERKEETHFHNWTYPCKSSLALQKYTQRIFLMLKKTLSVSFLRHSYHLKGNHYGDF